MPLCPGPAGGVLTGTYPNPGLADGVVDLTNLTDEARPALNILSNPGFNFQQLHDPLVYTALNDNDVGPDCWRCTFENTGVSYQRKANAGIFQSANRGSWKKTGSAGKIMIYQPLESLISNGIMSHKITLNVSFSLSNPHDIRLIFLQYNGGTPDILTAPVSAWNAVGSPPTLAANWSYIFDFLLTGVPAGQSSFFGDYGFLPNSGFTNFAVGIVTDDHVAINETIELAEIGLYEGFGGRFVWNPLTPNEDIDRVERQIEKTYDIDVLPGVVTNIGQISTTQASTHHVEPIRLKQRKPKTPRITLYNPDGSASEPTWHDADAVVEIPMAAQDVGTGGFSAVVATIGTNSNRLNGHYLADASI